MANDPLSNWRGDQDMLECECGSVSFWIFMLDYKSRIICRKCESDYTDAFHK